ncbi:GNAT family N-acetyltransferase [Barnesiella propionica]|uniref:GNAT family N-acetyltransferase n=1 Tax=Barnesiella propionica TaxID=2981781 RepID=UPI0011C8E146|nr:GNAT family protein [Barnesiella propionica]MCU6768274.1 GNAT family N-acetyltransferase [Barnesiella propionica]
MPYLTGKNITLRALEPEDLEILYHWENIPSLWKYGSTLAPFSRHILRQYLQDYTTDIYQTRQLRLMITFKDISIGTLDWYDYDPYHNRAAVGILIDEKYQRQGLGRDALNTLVNYSFGYLGLHQVYTYIPENNTASLRLFESCGFIRCGYMQEWLKEGNGYSSVITMQLINKNQKPSLG